MSAEQREPQIDVETEARTLGWKPREEYKGPDDKWVDAAEFVDNGHKFMPFIRSNNAKLIQKTQTLEQQLNGLRGELEAARGDLSTFQEFHNEEVARRVEETKQSLKQEIKQARDDNDVDRELDLQSKLSELNASVKEAEKEPESFAPPLTPDYMAWRAENPWFENDRVKTYETMATATRLREERPDLVNQAFYAELNRRLAGEPERKTTSKVEESRGGSNSNAGGRTYSDLPSDAKKQCDKWADKFVKPNGTWKTKDEYRRHFIEELEATGYFS